MIVEILVNLIGTFSDEFQLVLDPFRFIPDRIVITREVGLDKVSISIMGLHLILTLSRYLVSDFLVKWLDLLGKLGTLG
jgi:hypothetical protein